MSESEYDRGYRHGAKTAHEAHKYEVDTLRTQLEGVTQNALTLAKRLGEAGIENAALKQTIEAVRELIKRFDIDPEMNMDGFIDGLNEILGKK